MKTDRQIKADATKAMNVRVFENFNTPGCIYAECSDGVWVKKLISWVGGFKWSQWKRV